jgi:hypothetical protein
VAIWTGQKAENTCPRLPDLLKHRFIDFAQVAFWADQEVENVFAGPGNPLKHRFIELSKVVFCAGQNSENSHGLAPLQTLLSRTRQVAFLEFPLAENDF